MIQWLSGYYAQSPAIIAKAMAPKIYKSKKNKFNVPAKNLKNINANFNDKNINEYCDKIWHSTQKIQLYIGVPEPKFYTTLMSKCCGEGKQVLLVYPEIHMIDDAIVHYITAFGDENVAILHSKISKNKYFHYYQAIKANKIKIIIGTRIAIFAPYSHLGLVIIDSEHDNSLKQWDQNPRYHTIDIAQYMVKLYDTKLLLCSIAPRVTTYYNAKKNEWPVFRNLDISAKNITIVS